MIGPGSRVGGYEVRELIGKGGMGVVYRCVHLELEREAAIKVIQVENPNDELVERFRREGQAVAQMRHPNILQVFDFGTQDGELYLIIEMVASGSLAQRMSSNRLDVETSLQILEGIASAVDYAHRRGVLHRDIKPANVLIGEGNLPILADFGLAKVLSKETMTQTGVSTGTPAYMAPEQVTSVDVGPPADGYAVATIAYELIAGRVPFENDNLMALLYAKTTSDPPPPSRFEPLLGPAVDAVLARGLSRDPASRWPDCAWMVRSLRAAMQHQQVVQAQPAPNPAGAVGPVVQTTKRRRSPLRLAAAAIATVALVATWGAVLRNRLPANQPLATTTSTPIHTETAIPTSSAKASVLPSTLAPVAPLPSPSLVAIHSTPSPLVVSPSPSVIACASASGRISVNPKSTPSGGSVIVSGAGFSPNATVVIIVDVSSGCPYTNDNSQGVATAGPEGSFSTTVKPTGNPGTYHVHACLPQQQFPCAAAVPLAIT